MSPGAGEVVVAVRGLSVGYGARTVLRDVAIEVGAGEFWFLLGANGSGKSTLLNAILGVLPPRAGAVVRHPVLASRERLGFVPQRCEFNRSLPTTVREFVSLGLIGVHVPRAERGERLRTALAGAGLSELEDASYWSLSGGQRQRALIARALVRRPHLMVLDEPTEGLDPAVEDALIETLASLNQREGVTILFVTHRLPIALRYASHVALLRGGAVRAGPREQVLVPGELERAYGPRLPTEEPIPVAGSEAP